MLRRAPLSCSRPFGSDASDRAKRTLVAALLCVTAPFLPAIALAADRTDYLVKAGVMDDVSATPDKLRETQDLTMDPSRHPGWCFVVDPPGSDPYEVYSIHHLPGMPQSLTGDFAGTQPELAMAGMKTAVQRVDGIRTFCSDFHAGDPVGEYRVEVFINGVLNTTFQLQVVEPPAHVTEGAK